ncbi:hypothetical protein ACSTK7_23840, partial [Vibrio parahaemolyticus]
PSPYTRLAASRSLRELIGYILPFALAITVALVALNALTGSQVAAGIFSPNLNARFARATLVFAGIAYLLCVPALARVTGIR